MNDEKVDESVAMTERVEKICSEREVKDTMNRKQK
jgi:hypothetical protein